MNHKRSWLNDNGICSGRTWEDKLTAESIFVFIKKKKQERKEFND
jgi:hypothetical protein